MDENMETFDISAEGEPLHGIPDLRAAKTALQYLFITWEQLFDAYSDQVNVHPTSYPVLTCPKSNTRNLANIQASLPTLNESGTAASTLN